MYDSKKSKFIKQQEWSVIFFDKKISKGIIKKEIICNRELAEELHKIITRKFKKKKYTELLQKMFGVLILLIYK